MLLGIISIAFAVIVFLFLGASTISSVVCLILSFVKSGDMAGRFRIIAGLCLIPDLIVLCLFGYSKIKTYVKYHDTLAYYVLHEDYEKAEELIEAGASPNCGLFGSKPAAESETSLLLALCSSGYVYPDGLAPRWGMELDRLSMAEFLLEHGADPDIRYAVHAADYDAHFWQMEADASKGSDQCGFTPLMKALDYRELVMAELLIRYGADVNAVDYCGYTPAAVAVRNLPKASADEALDFLVEAGASLEVETNYHQTIAELYEDRFGEKLPFGEK